MTVYHQNDFPLAWKALEEHGPLWSHRTLAHLFQEDGERFKRFSRRFAGVMVDFSKTHLTEETLTLLLALAQSAGVPAARQAMFQGEAINQTENKPVLHTALRFPAGPPLVIQGVEMRQAVAAALEQMKQFCQEILQGKRVGASGQAITTLVHVGIGGSYLGPRMMLAALEHAHLPQAPEVRFLANVDGAAFTRCVDGLDPNTTLFILASKSFTTAETLRNAHTARQWLEQHLGQGVPLDRHFVAVTANQAGALAFGLQPDAIFPLWPWVGGRYSWASAVGLPVMASIGYDAFLDVLQGAHAMDEHFQQAPPQDNLPILLAMITIWYNNFLQVHNQVILPYSYPLRYFPAFYQQCEMESNGKSTRLDDTVAPYPTGPLVWGEEGTNGQHSFFQWLHQGSHPFLADFITVARPDHALHEHHLDLLANCFAQSEALMLGRGANDVPSQHQLPHRIFPGNRPSTTLILDQLSPFNLGLLLALYEMKTFIQGVVWGINSFDQWGVELGKEMVQAIRQEQQAVGLGTADHPTCRNASTRGLLNHVSSIWTSTERA